MSCGKHTTRRQAHATRRAKNSHTVRKAAHNAARQSTTNVARKATSAHAAHVQARAISKTRPKATTSSKAPKKRPNKKLTAAQLKARNKRHRILSKRARAHARKIAYAKVRAAQKAAAARRAAAKTLRSHAKAQRFYCQVATRTAAHVSRPVAPGTRWNLQPRKNPVRPVKAYTRPKPAKAVKAAKG
jgi:hypothetical protein